MQIGSIGFGTSAYGIGFDYGSYTGGLGATGAVDDEATATSAVKKSSPAECQTCKERKYVDGSDENVSFKSAAHIAPEAAMGAVRGHEGEHVANAYSQGSSNNGTVVNASVSIHMSVCPECGRSYVSGGTTNTTIRYNEANPLRKESKVFGRGGTYRRQNGF